MENNRRAQLLQEYKHRCPEMGVISVRCKETGEAFLGVSNDTRADFNSIFAKLSMNCHPNKRMQTLWNQFGAEGFERLVLRVLKYDDPHDDHSAALEKLREQCLAEDPQAKKIWL